MLQIIYESIAADTWDGDLDTLCEQSVPNNVRNEITGVMIFERGDFLHALEGPKATVEDTFLRIINDPRHQSLRLLSRRMLTEREFGYGAMAVLETIKEKDDARAQVRSIVSFAKTT